MNRATSSNNNYCPITKHILDDLCSRFIVNMPPDHFKDPVRLCFQIEQAYWYYFDYFDEESDKVDLRAFFQIIFNYVPGLSYLCEHVEYVMKEWRVYKSMVPTYGAIMIDDSFDHVLLVQGDSKKLTWGFPKGKVNEGETPHDCARREVKEETGYDLSLSIDPDAYFDRKINDSTVRLFVVTGVDRNFNFKPETRFEIKDIRWFRIEDLPDNKADLSRSHLGFYPQQLFLVLPFVPALKSFARRCKAGNFVLHSPTCEQMAAKSHYGMTSRGRFSSPSFSGLYNNSQQQYTIMSDNNHYGNGMTPKNKKQAKNRPRTVSLSSSNLVGQSSTSRSLTSSPSTAYSYSNNNNYGNGKNCRGQTTITQSCSSNITSTQTTAKSNGGRKSSQKTRIWKNQQTLSFDETVPPNKSADILQMLASAQKSISSPVEATTLSAPSLPVKSCQEESSTTVLLPRQRLNFDELVAGTAKIAASPKRDLERCATADFLIRPSAKWSSIKFDWGSILEEI